METSSVETGTKEIKLLHKIIFSKGVGTDNLAPESIIQQYYNNCFLLKFYRSKNEINVLTLKQKELKNKLFSINEEINKILEKKILKMPKALAIRVIKYCLK